MLSGVKTKEGTKPNTRQRLSAHLVREDSQKGTRKTMEKWICETE